MPTIRIDRIKIRVKGVSPEVVRLAMDGLGSRLLEQLAQTNALPRPAGDQSRLVAPPAVQVRVGANPRPAELCRALATALVGAVTSSGASSTTNYGSEERQSTVWHT